MRIKLAQAIFPGLICLSLGLWPVCAQTPFAVHDEPVPKNIERMYVRGLQYLARTQKSDGSWQDSYGRQAGVVGLGVLAFLAHGEDPNSGPYSRNIRKGLDYILAKADTSTGYIGSSMYNHGFATLALAEAYGMVDDPRVGKTLAKAVKLLLSSQAKNRFGAWRYSSSSTDADTTVSGACLVALLAARNAGIEIPEAAIKKALDYYRTCQCADGGFGYTSANGSNAARTAIGALVYVLARKKKSAVCKAAFRYLNQTPDRGRDYYYYYYLYYASQAFFQSTPKEWASWNKHNVAMLEAAQQSNGSWTGNYGLTFCTASGLLSLALNYRLLPIYER